MQVMYQSTRGKGEPVTASQAILKGLSEDGGLFVPTQIPALDVSMDELSRMTYQETAYQVMSRLLTDFTEEELRTCINRAYDKKFDTDVIAPLKEADGAYYLELFHGPTIAFKDMALSILPYLMTTAARKNNVKNEIVILTATSGLEEGTVFSDILNSFGRIASHCASAMTALMKSGEETTDIHIHNSRIYPTDSLEYYTYFKEYRQKYDIGTEVEHKLSMEPEEVE